MASEKISAMIEEIKGLTIIELNELVKTLEEEFGVSAAAMVSAGSAPQAAEAEAEEKTEFNLVLKSAGESKIKVIKVVRAITGLGLKEAKDLVDSAPKAIKENMSKEDAEAAAKELQEAGAEISLE